MFRLRPFDFSDADYAAIAAINKTVYPERHRRAQDYKHIDSYTPQDQYDWDRTIAEWDGQPVGYGLYTRALWLDAPDLYWVGWVTHPDYRKRGIATAYRHFLDNEVLPQRTVGGLMAQARSDKPDGVRFLRHSGFNELLRHRLSVLDLTTFDPQRFAAQTEAIAARGIVLKPLSTLLDSDPDHMEKLIALHRQLQEDEPHVVESAPLSAETFRNYYMSSESYHPEGWFIALDGDQYVGWSAVFPDLTVPDRMRNGITVIDRAYRRIGLATAMKAHALAYAKALGKRRVITGNGTTNPMLTLNQTIGFVPQFDEIDFKRTLA